MTPVIEECHFWWVRELYNVLVSLADDPANTVARAGTGQIPVPEEQSGELALYEELILDHYPDAADLAVMRAVSEVREILSRKSLGGEDFEEWFWSDEGFETHHEWSQIREIARGFLFR